MELRGLVQEGLAAQEGVGRWATYSLKAPREAPELFPPQSEEERILAFVRKRGSISNEECASCWMWIREECLAMLLKGTQPVVICPARSIRGMRVPTLWRKHIDDGRLLVVSVFPPEQKRVATELAERRNRFVAALALEAVALEASSLGKVRGGLLETPRWRGLREDPR